MYSCYFVTGRKGNNLYSVLSSDKIWVSLSQTSFNYTMYKITYFMKTVSAALISHNMTTRDVDGTPWSV